MHGVLCSSADRRAIHLTEAAGGSAPLTAPVLVTNEGGGVKKQELLALRVHCEEAAREGAGAGLRPAVAGPGRIVEGIEAVVDRDLVTSCNRMPGEDLYAMAHGVRVAGVVEVAAGRCENREAIESKLTEMDAFPLARPIELVAPEDSRVSAPEYELTFLKRSAGEDASALGPRVTYLDIADHTSQRKNPPPATRPAWTRVRFLMSPSSDATPRQICRSACRCSVCPPGR
jgi:hypothetical protein